MTKNERKVTFYGVYCSDLKKCVVRANGTIVFSFLKLVTSNNLHTRPKCTPFYWNPSHYQSIATGLA